MSLIIRDLYNGISYKPKKKNNNPLILLISLVVQFFAILIFNLYGLLIVAIVVLIESFLFKFYRYHFNLLKLIVPFAFFTGFIVFLFRSPVDALNVMLRIFCGALTFSTFLLMTNPADLSRAFEKLHIPSKLAFLPSLTFTYIPYVARDTEETVNALVLRGEIRLKRFLLFSPKLIALLLASAIYRSDIMAESLTIRGFGLKQRKPYKIPPITLTSSIRLVTWIILVIVALFSPFPFI